MKDIHSWLYETPGYTIFRINRLKEFNMNIMEQYLKNQSKELHVDTDPKLYLIKDDCLVLEKWSPDIIVEKNYKEVIVDALCAAAVLRGAHVFAPGVIGLPTNCRIGEQVDIYGDLEGNCKRGLKVPYNGKKIYAGTGYLKMVRSDLFDNNIQPSGIAVQTILPASRLPVINESLYPKGQLLLQNLPSIVCGWVVDAQPNEYILDMCASPGNKTTHLAEMSNDQATIIAIDKTQPKVDKIKVTCETQGVTCVLSYVFDSRKCCSENACSEVRSPPFLPNTFDKILLDAPCSGLGQRPQLINRMNPKVLESYKFVQRQLFDAAVKLLKVGGRLVYSTCTVTKDENEGMVAWVLEKHPCLMLVPAEPLLGGPGLPDCGLTDEQRVMVQRFGPEDDPLRPVEPIYKDTIGFFIAMFTKV